MSEALDAIKKMGVSELADKSGSELLSLLNDAQTIMATMRNTVEWIESVIAYKYVYRVTQLRSQLQQSYGEISFEDDGVQVLVDLPREVSWDQQKLNVIADRVRGQGEDPTEFLDIHYSVSEEKFDLWPQEIRRSFEPALKLSTGRAIYRLVALNQEVR